MKLIYQLTLETEVEKDEMTHPVTDEPLSAEEYLKMQLDDDPFAFLENSSMTKHKLLKVVDDEPVEDDDDEDDDDQLTELDEEMSLD